MEGSFNPFYYRLNISQTRQCAGRTPWLRWRGALEGPNMVKEMDPDARCRTGKKLHDIDLEDKQRLLKALFVCMRCELLEEGQDLSVRVGQEWRSLRSRDQGFTMILTMRVV